MKILGISGSPRSEKQSGVYALVKAVLEATGMEYELISLRNKSIGGCIACLGCAKDNVCKVNDDMTDLREKVASADAYVIGAPNYYANLNALTHAFLERWFQFRHQEGNTLWGKLGVAVGVGGMNGNFPANEIEKMFLYNFIEPVTRVVGQGAASCYTCGYGETCKVGVVRMIHGDDVKITPDMIPDVKKSQCLMDSAAEAGKILAARLKENYDRNEVTMKMQQKMMEMVSATV